MLPQRWFEADGTQLFVMIHAEWEQVYKATFQGDWFR
jgi:hypothetical protein